MSILRFAVLAIALMSYSPNGNAQLTAPSIRELVSEVQTGPLQFFGKIKLFGYYSTNSCLYKNEKFILIRHYCHDDKNFPARSFTIWSKKFGITQFYEEDFGHRIRREIELDQFAFNLQAVLPDDLRTLQATEVNDLMELLYYEHLPACWSANFDLNSGLPHFGCYKTTQDIHELWIQETQEIVQDPPKFNLILRQLTNLVQSVSALP